jgi:Protein of unknown function (DUF4236)
MQKVVGSSPIIRSTESPAPAGLFLSRAHSPRPGCKRQRKHSSVPARGQRAKNDGALTANLAAGCRLRDGADQRVCVHWRFLDRLHVQRCADTAGEERMGFFFRKSVKIAPGIRLNVSKRGLGLSGGVRGARVSANTKGETYVSGGRRRARVRRWPPRSGLCANRKE